ncbi:hypothetical protein [Pseudomonas phage TH15]|uniref:Uncharacterized protein n=1 Tax=Pseudomonas phage TH15 TaxID=2801839 RepID=A0A7T7Z826_9CAUD|nr:hypothetical protein [Pseudomonas phage TH15]
MVIFDEHKFRTLFPEFADQAAYPDVRLQMYFDIACEFISDRDSPYRILNGKALEACLYLLTAHLLSLSTMQVQGAAGGGVTAGGTQGGFITSATVGEVSVAKLAPPAKNGWQWWLSGTPYGQELWALLSVKAVGGFYIGGLPERQGFRKVGGTFW